MPFPIVLAHGALGPLDELILPVMGGAFIGLILITWWNSRKNEQIEPGEEQPTDRAAQPPEAEPEPSGDPTHFRLD